VPRARDPRGGVAKAEGHHALPRAAASPGCMGLHRAAAIEPQLIPVCCPAAGVRMPCSETVSLIVFL